MAADPVRIGLIGAGRMGRVHLGALARARGVVLAGVVEPGDGARAAVAADGHAVYARPEELLDAGGVDAVLIAAPSDLHLALVRTFAERDVPVLCEKPVGVHRHEALAAAAVADEFGTILQVGYWRRFVPALRALRDRIGAGELGQIYQLTCLQWDAEPPAAAFRAHSGGIAVDMGVHEFDQACWLTGQAVEWVLAAPAGSEPGHDPDAATILAQLSGGVTTTISLGRRFPHGDCCWLEVFGSGGYERLPFMWGASGDDVFRAALVAQVEAFVAWIRGDERAGADGADAITALAAAELAGESLADGRPRQVLAGGEGQS